MAQNLLVSTRDVQFVLFETLKADRLAGFAEFDGYDNGMFNDTLGLAERLAWTEWYPVDLPGDEEGVHYDPRTREVRVPEIFHAPYRAMTEAGFIAISEKDAEGGMGMPQCISVACKEYLCGASAALAFFTLLSGSAAGLVRRFGSAEQKGLYLKKMLQGTWSGTMCLTEPGAGSDVGAIRTSAVAMPDGSYRISGQKIFISAGEHDLTENIIHMVLARIEGAPQGTRGISLFIVPKYLVDSEGRLGARNGVFCTGVEQKMGFHGSPTCALSFGDDQDCTGFLLGSPGAGMKLMFRMMNEERLFCGLQGLAVSSSAYLHAVDYARLRQQGVHVSRMMDSAAPKVPIIEHPDVKRMLLWMKAYVEGMRQLTYYLAFCIDLAGVESPEGAREANAMVELLVPICKAGNTDMAWLVIAEAIQVFGGYGFCRDYPVEHMARACKVLSIVEGTNGIQSIDLVMRKILMNPGQYNYELLKRRIAATIADARGVVDESCLALLARGVSKLDEVVSQMQAHLAAGRVTHIFARATRLQQAMFMLVLAWMHVWSLSVALPKLQALPSGGAADNPEADFYRGKVLASRFYLADEFPRYFGRIECLLREEEALLQADAACF